MAYLTVNFTKATTARRVNLEHVARLHLDLTNVFELFHLATGPHHPVQPDLTRLAARHAEGAVFAGNAIRQHKLFCRD